LPPLPFLGVSVHKSWLAKNREQAQALYNAYKQAADWVLANPSDAARIISEATKIPAAALEDVLRSGRIGLRVQPALNGKDTVLAALQLALQTKQVDKVPAADGFFYTGLK
jgi:ABC-type nitrate/sulfonate/bicarbonate transport system substrate-binding protein